MADTESAIQTRLDAVNAEIDAIVAASDSKAVDYTFAGMRVDKTKRLKELRELRKDLIEELRNLPCWEETIYDDPAL